MFVVVVVVDAEYWPWKSAHTILFFDFFGFLIFWVHPSNKQQRNSIYHQNIVYILCQKYSHPDVENRRAAAVPELTQTINVCRLLITNYQMAPSKRGAGGGSATHKEPTLAPTAYTISCPSSNNGCHQPTLNPLLANVCQASPFRLAMR